jgi:hypothetical protein
MTLAMMTFHFKEKTMLDFLSTMPDMTNTPEITMQEPKTPISKRIRDYKEANPDATARQVADAVGTTAVYVHQVLANPLKKAKKGRPATKPKENNPINKKEVDALKEEIEMQNLIIDAQKKQVERLQTVIEYLEAKVDDMGGLVC